VFLFFCQTSRYNNRLHFEHQTVHLYEWAKFTCKSLQSRSTSTSSFFHSQFSPSGIHSFSTRQHKRRTSNTTLKHKTFCQLDISQTFFPKAEHFHTFPYSLEARKCLVHCTLKHVLLPKCFRVKLTNKSHTSQDFRLSRWKHQLRGPFATGLLSTEVVIWTPCFMWVIVQYFKSLQLNMGWGFSVPVMEACCVILLIDKRLEFYILFTVHPSMKEATGEKQA